MPDALLALQILSTISYAIALLTTAFRITHRVRIARFWWDDFWALVSAFLIAILLVFLWLVPYLKDHGTLDQLVLTAWIGPLVFNVVVWTTRISICYSITRILPPGKARTISLILIVAFFVSCAGVFAGKVWICAHDSSWHYLPSVSCPQNDAVNVAQVTIDIISILCLVVFPFHVLRRVDLPAPERRLVLALFATSLVIATFVIPHSVFAFRPSWVQLFAWTGHLEAGVSQIICNVLVVGTWFYRVFRHSDESDSLPPPAISQLEAQVPPVTFTQIITTTQHESIFSHPSRYGSAISSSCQKSETLGVSNIIASSKEQQV